MVTCTDPLHMRQTWHRDSTESFISTLLSRIRKFADSEEYELDRFPQWIKAADIKIGRLNNTTLFVFEGSNSEKDEVIEYDEISCDLELLLNLSPFEPKGFVNDFSGDLGDGMIILHGTRSDESRSSIRFPQDQDVAWTNLGFVPYHPPRAVLDVGFEREQNGSIIGKRYIPFALFVHDYDLVNFDEFWQKSAEHLFSSLALHHDEFGDYFESQSEQRRSLQVGKDRTVIVLGPYDEPYLSHLVHLREHLKGEGYDANLIKDLASAPMMNFQEKAKYWTIASRFCILNDEVPSGALDEYEYLKSQQTITAILRPEGDYPSAMAHGEHLRLRYFELFEYKESPLEVVEEAVEWAENIIQERMAELS